jgi:hypothetical protein
MLSSCVFTEVNFMSKYTLDRNGALLRTYSDGHTSKVRQNRVLKCQPLAIRRARLLSDGRKALAMLADGHKPRHVMMVIPGGRARLYRAMALARESDAQDPLMC